MSTIASRCSSRHRVDIVTGIMVCWLHTQKGKLGVTDLEDAIVTVWREGARARDRNASYAVIGR